MSSLKAISFVLIVFFTHLPVHADRNTSSGCKIFDPLNCVAEKIFNSQGVVDPELYHMRYRYNEYEDDKPFFQWWYYTIKDHENNTYFAFDIAQSIGPDDQTNDGTYIMFSMVDRDTNTQFHKYERYAVPDMKVINNGRPGFQIFVPNIQNPNFKFDFLNKNTYRTTGRMNNSEKLFFADGLYNGAEVESELEIEWDLTIHRIYGWYGQPDLRYLLQNQGIISWNTYAHTSEVEGTITINGKVYTFERKKEHRAYADMNWGENFPAGASWENPIDYPWGWYYAALPSDIPSEDIGIIAGIGRHHPIPSLFGKTEGSFADIRLPGGEQIGVRYMSAFKLSPDTRGYTVVGNATDGELYKFSVDRSNWGTYVDKVGTAEIPFRQVVTIKTDKKRITMDFESEPEDYNRLLFPHQNYLFSDFEGLGVTCTVKIEEYQYQWWDLFKLRPIYKTIYEFVTDDAGLEYGYDTRATNFTNVFNQ